MDESRALLTGLARLFNEGIMGLLALVALATALGPLVFDVGVDFERALTVVEWVLVGIFAADFFIQGAVAPDFPAWIRSPWRIVDVVTVLGPVVALLPQVSDLASGSLMLRMLRVGRAVAFGTRAGSVTVRKSQRAAHVMRGSAAFSVITEDDLHPVTSDWDSFIAWTREQGPSSWVHASNLDRRRFDELARGAGLSDRDLERILDEDGHGKVLEGARCAALVLQVPTVPDAGFPEVRWDQLLLLTTDRGLLTAMTGSLELQKRVVLAGAAFTNLSFRARLMCALLSLTRDQYKLVAQRFDEEARHLEAQQEGNDLLRGTFRLRHEISAAARDLWQVKRLVRALADGKVKLHGVDLKDEKPFDDLAQETESLHLTISEIKEGLKSLIELHITLKSFEMNKLLKLLAVVSFLGLIPAVVGGLLGMNVVGNPWPVTLGQVAFGVAMGMAMALYVFAVKGWLK